MRGTCGLFQVQLPYTGYGNIIDYWSHKAFSIGCNPRQVIHSKSFLVISKLLTLVSR